METETTLVRANCVVELYAVTDIYMYLTGVVCPGHTERENTVWLNDTFDDAILFEFGMLIVHILDREENLFNCLEEFFFARVLSLQLGENLICLHSKQNNNEVSADKDRHIIHTKQLRNRRKSPPNRFSTTHQEESQQPQSALEGEKGNTET